MKDYYDAADKLNIAAGKIKKAGMQTGFHNHEMEFAMLEDQLIYNALMSRYDPGRVKMQFQTEVINLGYKASAYFTNTREGLSPPTCRIGLPIKSRYRLARVLLTGKNFCRS